jgi:hypothetical protein
MSYVQCPHTQKRPRGATNSRDPAHRERSCCGRSKDTPAGDGFYAAGKHRDDTLEAHYSSLERPHACYDGWVFLGFEGEDENGEPGEVIERVPCRRCQLVNTENL